MTHGEQHRSRARVLLLIAVVLGVTIGMVAAPMTVAAQDDPPQPPHRVYGDVTDADGEAVANATVQAVDDDTGDVLVETTTNSDGYYDVNVEEPDGDTFTIEVVDAEDGSETVEWSSGSSDRVNIQVAEAPPDDEDDADDGDDTDDGDDGDDAGTGGTGGGGGQPADDDDDEDVDEPASKAVALAGTNPTVRIDAGESISMIGFGSEVELDDTASITEVTETPSPAPQGATFVTGAEITFSSTNGEDVDTVQMGVQQSTLDDLGVSAEQLVLHHLNEDGEWETLETEVVSEDNFEVVLEAPSAGFSTYAVFAQEDEDVTTTTAAPTTEAPTTTAAPTTEQPPTTTEAPGDEGPGTLLIGGVLVVVLALIAALYLAFGRE
ncbi:Cell surface protein containing PGF C-terminal sorting motif [Halanaeroarchaeum sp. HSR-CO]|uniref:PGF-pre-PGF domain-containing protein n=1 Tax=Halanaeroarchaeum sp. HSR-CO TaxID=2866382 RepID=UPI00217CDAB8|nr:PGF-pre-PGF domain-containing protein [Halanaeroarchaeum sp. HSR-CO]UWG47034.1 Cell surface protein containing PGF C-terminal sorting motif [Halanaeroarchaeum sp. HSR-CO]